MLCGRLRSKVLNSTEAASACDRQAWLPKGNQRDKCCGIRGQLTTVAVLQLSHCRSGDRRNHIVAKGRSEASCLAVKRGKPLYRTQTSSLVSDPRINAD